MSVYSVKKTLLWCYIIKACQNSLLVYMWIWNIKEWFNEGKLRCFRKSTPKPRTQLCFSWHCWATLLGKFIMQQKTGLHLLQRWHSTSSSTRYRKMCPSTLLYCFLMWHIVCVITLVQTHYVFVVFNVSWASILFKPLDSLQWPLLPPQPLSSNMVQCSERVPQRRRRSCQYSQHRGPKLCHFPTWIW